MDWNEIEGEWKERRGKGVHHWGKMINDLLAAIAGKYKELVRRLQKKYGIAKGEARRKLEELKKKIKQFKKPNNALIESLQELSQSKKADRKPVKSKTPARKKKRSKTNG